MRPLAQCGWLRGGTKDVIAEGFDGLRQPHLLPGSKPGASDSFAIVAMVNVDYLPLITPARRALLGDEEVGGLGVIMPARHCYALVIMPARHGYALVIKTARRALLGGEEVGGPGVAVHRSAAHSCIYLVRLGELAACGRARGIAARQTGDW